MDSKSNASWNKELAVSTIRELHARGVEEFCICPGARNAPWVAVFKANAHQVKTYYFFEERSAAFFALGRIRQTGKPVAVVTTSGTAAGELLPATMEAHYVGLPLVLLTADRPRRYRNSGAPQTAEQVGIFGVYVSQCIDLAAGEKFELSSDSFSRPLHVNVCFDEPLLEKSTDSYLFSLNRSVSHDELDQPLLLEGGLHQGGFRDQLQSFFERSRSPFVVVGMVHPEDREGVVQLLQKWQYPAYFEGLSGLREDPRLAELRIQGSDKILERASQRDYRIDGIIRIGGVPTLRLWRDLELGLSSLPVLNLSRVGFSGLGRFTWTLHGNLSEITQACLKEGYSCENLNSSRLWRELDREKFIGLQKIIESEPLSEPSMIYELSRHFSKKTRLYLGNSMPIREWDLAAAETSQLGDIWGSRGLNGIDGQVSQFLGFANSESDNWAILGDLTALYDLPGPWILKQLKETQVNLVVVNNGGGKIFSRMFSEVEFQNQHQIRFGAWADLWGLKYEEWRKIPKTIDQGSESRIIEIIPDEDSTARFWERYKTL